MTSEDQYIIVLTIILLIVLVVVPLIVVAANINSVNDNNPDKTD